MKPPARWRWVLLFLIGVLLAVFFILPKSRTVRPDEEVAFFSPYLFWDPGDHLNLVLRGRLYEPERNHVSRRIAVEAALAPSLLRYVGQKKEGLDAEARERMVERLAPFLYDGKSHVRLTFRLRGRGGESVIHTPATNAGGYFSMSTASAADRSIAEIVGDSDKLEIEAILAGSDTRQFKVSVNVPPRSLPLLVISDVDDTVRIGEVLNRRRMIERVFLMPYEAVPGMSELYNQLADQGACIHFVSGSPWQIDTVIEQFLGAAKFPPAVMHGRELGWDFWNSDPLHIKDFKIKTIEKLLDQFGSCKALCIGDDGQYDPEVYTEICRKHRDRVAGIWIRRVRP